jgi:hypothetical protein
MEYTVELKKVDDARSIVLWVHASGRKEFVVCSYYDETKPVGQQWCWGHYFQDVCSAVDYTRKEN